MRLLLLLIVTALLSPGTLAKERQRPARTPRIVLDDAEAAALTLYAPRPDYPRAARLDRVAGRGIFRLHTQIRTGLVKSVEVDRSTGSRILDGSALKALRQWRFRPRRLQVLQQKFDSNGTSGEIDLIVPVIFKM